MGCQHLVWRCTDNHTSSHASPNAGSYSCSHSCSHAGAHAGAHTGSYDNQNHINDASANDNHINDASADSATHAGAHASTYTDVRLQRGPVRRRFPVPLRVGLLRCGRTVLQRESDLDVPGMHRNRRIHKHAHSRAHRGVYAFAHSCAHFAKLTDAGAISEFRWQWYQCLVLAGRFRGLLPEYQQCGLHRGELLHLRRPCSGSEGLPQLREFG